MIRCYCLLMEFSVRWVSGLSEWAWLAIRGVVPLMPDSIFVSAALLSHILKTQSLLYTNRLSFGEAYFSLLICLVIPPVSFLGLFYTLARACVSSVAMCDKSRNISFSCLRAK